MTAEPIHRWYTSVMGFAPTLVRTALVDLKCDESGYLLDPFCGTGTTLIECNLSGIKSIGVDANPFSAFCSRAKTAWSVDPHDLEGAFERIVSSLAEVSASPKTKKKETIPHAVRKGWVSPHVWDKAIDIYARTRRLRNQGRKRLLQLAVISAVKETCANVAFGPEIYKRKRSNRTGVVKAISQKIKQIAEDLRGVQARRSQSAASIFHGDSRNLDFLARAGYKGRIKWVISSPPYPTEHDYSRISRIELELGGFIQSDMDLRSIKRLQLRSNSKTVYADDTDWKYVQDVGSVMSLVKRLENLARNKTYSFAHRYPLVVSNYFGGLYLHLSSLADLMPAGGTVMYILGEQRSYLGVLVPTTDVFIELACDRLRAFRLVKRVIVRLRRGTNGTVGPIREEAAILQRR